MIKIITSWHVSLVSQGDVGRNDFTPENDQLPEDPKYDKFAYENDKKLWGLNDGFNEDGEDEEVYGSRGHAKKNRRLHFTSGMLYKPEFLRGRRKRGANSLIVVLHSKGWKYKTYNLPKLLTYLHVNLVLVILS